MFAYPMNNGEFPPGWTTSFGRISIKPSLGARP